MNAYQFQFYAGDGARPGFSFAECETDTAAFDVAVAELSKRDTCRGVEVWKGEHMIARLETSKNDAHGTEAR